MRLLLLALLLVLPGADAFPLAPRNAGFDEVAPSGAPAGWIFEAPFGQAGYRFESVPGASGRAGRLYLRGSRAATGNADIHQVIDATPWRGKRVRLSARLKVAKPGTHIGLALQVTRPHPKFAGFTDRMEERPARAPEWTRYEIVGRVAPDALNIGIAVQVRGDADVSIDDLVLETLPDDPTPPSPVAAAYLREALEFIRTRHIDSRTADWPRIEADARVDIAGAQVPSDVYPAIRGVLGALGEKHSFLIPAAMLKGSGGGAPASNVFVPADPPMPASGLIEGRIGMVRLPGLSTFGPQGQATGARYQQTLRTALETLDKAPLCGWIVDLRGNTGGNMWPMLSGLDPLLGAAPFGHFVTGEGQAVQAWQRIGGAVVPGGAANSNPPAFALRHANAPVAVLIGPMTASSGEMTAIALIGRPGVRTFGETSADFTSGNTVFTLSDGAVLGLTTIFVRDRVGKDYKGPIEPDERSGAARAQDAAMRWLTASCPKR